MPSNIRTTLLCATLAGSIVGMLVFGVLGDWLGRKRMYGWLLVIIIWATWGLAASAEGADKSMNITAWLFVWRFFMGIGIGGDYPLSAIITSEFAPTKHRSTMLAWVFFMQPLGQFTGTVVAMITIAAFRSQMQVEWRQELTVESIRAIDRAWRIIVGFGAIPALVALFIRFGIPESPRFTMDILLDTKKAVQDAEGYFFVVADGPPPPQSQEKMNEHGEVPDFSKWDKAPADTGMELTNISRENISREQSSPAESSTKTKSPSMEISAPMTLPATVQTTADLGFYQENLAPRGNSPKLDTLHPPSRPRQSIPRSNSRSHLAPSSSKPATQDLTYTKIQIWTSGFRKWLGTGQNGLHLAGTTITWGILDFSFYGLGMSSASTIQEIWDGPCADIPHPGPDLSKRADDNTTPTVYDLLFGNSWHSSVVVSIGALTGGMALIFLIQRMRPKLIQTVFFAVLGLFLILVGGVFRPLMRRDCLPRDRNHHWGVVVLYIFCQIFFNLGANATTFIVSFSCSRCGRESLGLSEERRREEFSPSHLIPFLFFRRFDLPLHGSPAINYFRN